jgi:hypothetical protein
MTIKSAVRTTTLLRAMTEAAAATRFSFLYHNLQRPEHFYDVSITFNETLMPTQAMKGAKHFFRREV